MKKKLAIGIDLGTSNCAVAVQELSSSHTPGDLATAQILPIMQIVGPDQYAELDLMPSTIYLATQDEYEGGHFRLPHQDQSTRFLLGQAARERASSVADRVVVSAKSWLGHDKIDRNAPILPWKSEITSEKISPVEASRQFLEHLRLNCERYLQARAIADLDECEVTVTVPASFDEAARTLTVEAAEQAGFRSVTVLEEPQAALYSWIAENGSQWRKAVSAGDVVLVCDVGGGTADFSLIAVTEKDGELGLDRISVGDHILLGGDNMDLALAFHTRAKLAEEGTEIDDWQFQSLIHTARSAKERLLEDASLESFAISIPSRGSDLFASNVSSVITQQEVHQVLVAGFFPEVGIEAKPSKIRQAGLREIGLPYASDPALTKHLAHFLTISLTRYLADPNRPELNLHEGIQHIAPTSVLFNGGVFNADLLRNRMLKIIQSWSTHTVQELSGTNRDRAVAQGAANYAATKATGQGLRIRSGTTRSYYIGIESAAPAVPGFSHPVNGICVLPHGTEEGTELSIDDLEFSLYTGEESQFRLFSSSDRPADRPGTAVKDAEKNLEEGAPVSSMLPSREGSESELVNVCLHAKVTEVGVLELWMHHTESEAKWKLEFNVRPNE
jgi:hypothetical protein